MLLAPRWPPATGLASYLSGCIFLVVGRRPSRVSPPKPGTRLWFGQTFRPSRLIPPIRLPTLFALPPHQGEPWSQELYHTPILRLTTDT